MLTKQFWKEAFERAVKTGVEGAIAVWAGDAANVLPSITERPMVLVSGILGGAILSLALSIVSSRIGPADSPSVVTTEPAGSVG